MSVTFRIDAPSQFQLQPFPRHDDPDYWAKGEAVYEANLVIEEQRAEIEGEFNVANSNALYIVTELLGESPQDYYCGSLDAGTAALRLNIALAMGREAAGVRAPSEDSGVVLTAEGVSKGATVIDCGRSLSQMRRYVAQLQHLINVATERGCGICWA